MSPFIVVTVSTLMLITHAQAFEQQAAQLPQHRHSLPSATPPAPPVPPALPVPHPLAEKDTDGAFVEDDWQARIWNGKVWAPKELRTLETKKAGKVFVVTHASLVDADVVYLSNEKQMALPGKDFEIVARVSGTGKVGLQRANGGKQGTILKEIDRADPLTFTIKRESGKITFLVANQPGNPVSGKNTSDDLAYVFVVELKRKESIRIHDFKITIAK